MKNKKRINNKLKLKTQKRKKVLKNLMPDLGHRRGLTTVFIRNWEQMIQYNFSIACWNQFVICDFQKATVNQLKL